MKPLSMPGKSIRSATTWDFFKQFLESPLQVGSIVPSSKQLTRSMFLDVMPKAVKTYVEYGPGTGSFTAQAFSWFEDLQRQVLIEINPVFQKLLRQSYPEAEIYSSPNVIMESLRNQVDLIVSGLPFTHIPWEVTRQTIDASHDLLREGGSFRTFLYVQTFFLPKNRMLRAYLAQNFSQVRVRFVAKNFPPAFVIEARK